jgi:hypothetical protein
MTAKQKIVYLFLMILWVGTYAAANAWAAPTP